LGGSQGSITTSDFADNECHGNTGAPGQSGTPADNGGAIFADDESVVAATAGSSAASAATEALPKAEYSSLPSA
jgi:hypothetical protein